MAANSDYTKAKTSVADFVDQAKFSLENFYPKWKEIYNASPETKQETICIPDALDVLPNRRFETSESIAAECEQGDSATSSRTRENFDYAIKALKRGLVGQNGENKVVAALRQLQLGGILICGFNTEEFIKKIINKKNLKKWKQHFECDAIFLHHRLGVFLIETKACDNVNVVSDRIGVATEQIKKEILGLKEIYRRINGAEFPLEFHGVICVPNMNVAHSHVPYQVLGKAEIEGKDFKQFWFSHGPLPRENCEEESEESLSESMISFIAVIVAYRSAKFVSLPTNALEIYRIINQQEFRKENKDNEQKMTAAGQIAELQSMKMDSIILNREQLRAVESTVKRLFISGPPGTGKTTVMLLRALEAAKLDKPGRVVIFEGSNEDHLRHLFQKFIAENRSDDLKREIIVKKCDSELSKYLESSLPDDDIFFDEICVEFGDMRIFFENQPDWRKTASGTTTMIITGRWYPQRNPDEMRRALKYFEYFDHISLNTVIRGTLSIIDEWKKLLSDQLITPGHNVTGAPVERTVVTERNEVMVAVERKVSKLLNAKSMAQCELPNNVSFAIAPCHIAILVSLTYNSAPRKHELLDNIKSHLLRNGFPCGNLTEQVNNKNVVAIGYPDSALSFDWPVVIYVRGNDAGGSDHLVPLSRCISKLIIIEVTEEAFSSSHPPSLWSKFKTWLDSDISGNNINYNSDDTILSHAVADRGNGLW